MKLLLSLLIPVILVFGGGGLAVLGIEQEWSWLVWFGLIMVGAGIVWGLFHYLWAESGTFWNSPAPAPATAAAVRQRN